MDITTTGLVTTQTEDCRSYWMIRVDGKWVTGFDCLADAEEYAADCYRQWAEIKAAPADLMPVPAMAGLPVVLIFLLIGLWGALV